VFGKIKVTGGWCMSATNHTNKYRTFITFKKLTTDQWRVKENLPDGRQAPVGLIPVCEIKYNFIPDPKNLI
jgi:hypothetical protein